LSNPLVLAGYLPLPGDHLLSENPFEPPPTGRDPFGLASQGHLSGLYALTDGSLRVPALVPTPISYLYYSIVLVF